MDNSRADRLLRTDQLIGRQRCLEKLSEVFRAFWTNTKTRTVFRTILRLVRISAGDQNAARALRLQQCCQRFAHPAAVSENESATAIGLRGGWRGCCLREA